MSSLKRRSARFLEASPTTTALSNLRLTSESALPSDVRELTLAQPVLDLTETGRTVHVHRLSTTGATAHGRYLQSQLISSGAPPSALSVGEVTCLGVEHEKGTYSYSGGSPSEFGLTRVGYEHFDGLLFARGVAPSTGIRAARQNQLRENEISAMTMLYVMPRKHSDCDLRLTLVASNHLIPNNPTAQPSGPTFYVPISTYDFVVPGVVFFLRIVCYHGHNNNDIVVTTFINNVEVMRFQYSDRTPRVILTPRTFNANNMRFRDVFSSTQLHNSVINLQSILTWDALAHRFPNKRKLNIVKEDGSPSPLSLGFKLTRNQAFDFRLIGHRTYTWGRTAFHFSFPFLGVEDSSRWTFRFFREGTLVREGAISSLMLPADTTMEGTPVSVNINVPGYHTVAELDAMRFRLEFIKS